MILKLGMYVRCPIDEDINNPRLFVLGQVTSIDGDKATVTFHDLAKIRQFFEYVPASRVFYTETLRRCKILDFSQVLFINGSTTQKGQIICSVDKNEEDSFLYYYLRIEVDGENLIKVVCEKDIKVQFTRMDVNPLQQMMSYELQNPIWHEDRKTVIESLHVLKNATFGFETLVGSRVLLLPHQVDTIIRAVREPQCRFMLADEVGLGKTIEACVTMKGLKKKYTNLKTLILTPDSLTYQWQNEISIKLWTDIPIWGKDKYTYPCDLIFPIEKIMTEEGLKVLSLDWDLCIVDETHRLLGMDKEYSEIFELSKKVEHILLLSATPIQQRKTEYLRLLSLLFPDRYGGMDESRFNELIEKQAFLRGRIHKLVRDLDDYPEDDLLREDYIVDLKEIAENLENKTFSKIVESIDLCADDYGLEMVRLALAYIGEHYQIEERIIRHRRLELKEQMPSRTLEVKEYQLSGADNNFYEYDVYETLLSYLETVMGQTKNSILVGEYIRLSLSAMFSSPWALHEVILKRISTVKQGPVVVHDKALLNVNMLNSPRKEKERRERIIENIPSFDGEIEALEEILSLNNRWRNGVED